MDSRYPMDSHGIASICSSLSAMVVLLLESVLLLMRVIVSSLLLPDLLSCFAEHVGTLEAWHHDNLTRDVLDCDWAGLTYHDFMIFHDWRMVYQCTIGIYWDSGLPPDLRSRHQRYLSNECFTHVSQFDMVLTVFDCIRWFLLMVACIQQHNITERFLA